jgi:hypothetical protein
MDRIVLISVEHYNHGWHTAATTINTTSTQEFSRPPNVKRQPSYRNKHALLLKNVCWHKSTYQTRVVTNKTPRSKLLHTATLFDSLTSTDTRQNHIQSNRYQQARNDHRSDNDSYERRVEQLLDEINNHKDLAQRHKEAHDEKHAALEALRSEHDALHVRDITLWHSALAPCEF